MAVDLGVGVANLRSQVKTLLEWQRHDNAKQCATTDEVSDMQSSSEKPTVDIQDALRSSFNVLLHKTDPDHVVGSTAESDAFQIVTMAVQLQDFQFTEEEQASIAEVVYQLWYSTSPGVTCRNLLEAMLARRTGDTAAFINQLLRILQQTFTVGNKRSLQLLLNLYDSVDQDLLEETFPDLVEKLGLCITSQSGAQPAAKILSKVALRQNDGDILGLLDFLKPFIPQESFRAKQSVYEDLLPPILSQVPELQQPLLEWLQLEAPTSSNHLFALLVLARMCSIKNEAVEGQQDRYDDLIAASLIHEDPLIRFEAFRLLSSLPQGASPARRFNLHHLSLHTMFWKYNLTDSDSPAVRTGLIGEWKNFIVRAKLSSNAASKLIVKHQKRPASEGSHPDAVEAQRYLDALQSFFQSWAEYATDQLSSVKPYRCQISSLMFLQILLEHGIDPTFKAAAPSRAAKGKDVIHWPIKVEIVTRSFKESLVTCMRSTYDDIRNLAYGLLVSTPLEADLVQLVHDYGFMLVQRKRDADISSATLFLRLASATAKADMATGESSFDILSGTVPKLVDMLVQRIEAFRVSFSEAADEQPVHGILQSLAHLLQSSVTANNAKLAEGFKDSCRQCVAAIYDVWEVTKPILCRGDLDLLDETEEGGEDSSDQIVLNASWRSIKEGSNLMSVVLALPPDLRSVLWTTEELSRHASLFATWLIEITHRGVFAHVSQAYSRLCSALVREKGSDAHLPDAWLKKHLVDILDAERPFARRSAGLPYLLLGVLSSFPPQSAPLQHAFQRLVDVASPATSATDATRTHSIHCLRVLLQDGKMAMATKPYIQAAFQVAIPGFGNKHWGVRNSSLLLYASLIQRLFSTRKENHLPLSRRTSIVDFFSQYPGLVTELVTALKSGLGKAEPESLGSVFAVLLLLSLLATPSASARALEIVSAFLPLVDACAASPVWKVRKTAAAALTGLVAQDQVFQYCQAILGTCSHATPANELHGRLLQTHALLSCSVDNGCSTQNEEPATAWSDILQLLDSITHSDQSLPVLTQSLEIIALSPGAPPACVSATLHTLGCRHYGQRRPGYETYHSALARILLKVEPERYLSKCLSSQYLSSQAEALEYVATRKSQNAREVSYLQDQLIQLVTSDDTSSTNKVAALKVLSERLTLSPNQMKLQSLVDMHRSVHVPAVRQSMLPLLAGLANSESASSELKSYVKHEIASMINDEAGAARESAGHAMSSMPSWSKEDPFHFYHQLAQFLQDDDIDVRRRAGSVASAHLAQGQPVCTSRAIELAWRACKMAASDKDAQWLLEGLVQDLKESTEAAQAGPQLLFAVERANMHLDITLNLQQSVEVLQQHRLSLQCENGEARGGEAGLSQQDLQSVTSLKKHRQGGSSAEEHEIRNAYKPVEASLISDAVKSFLRQ